MPVAVKRPDIHEERFDSSFLSSHYAFMIDITKDFLFASFLLSSFLFSQKIRFSSLLIFFFFVFTPRHTPYATDIRCISCLRFFEE